MLRVVATLSLAFYLAAGLEPFDNFREGSCSRNHLQPVMADRLVINSFRYFTGGSRYNIFSVAAKMPNYSSMTEADLFYDSCYSRNSSTIPTENRIGAIFGFGRPLVVYRANTRPGIYFEGTPTDPAQAANTETTTVTLTDHKTFAFVANCWNRVDQRGWVVLSKTPHLDSETQRIVEEHAVSLGFKRENFVFLRHDSCRFGHGNPLLGSGQ